MERCPICKARIKTDTPICPRCSTDLSILLGIDLDAKRLISDSVRLLDANQLIEAAKVIDQSVRLRRDPLALALQNFIQHKRRVSAELFLL